VQHAVFIFEAVILPARNRYHNLEFDCSWVASSTAFATLITTVCYPESYTFSSSATVWGCQHEKHARDIFVDKLKDKHENVKLDEVGFFINPNVPFIGASPDGMVTCDCCGD
jgi:hypothetical protein